MRIRNIRQSLVVHTLTEFPANRNEAECERECGAMVVVVFVV